MSLSSTFPPAERELPLAGVLVVAVEQAVAAPFATRQLADLGARVIKVERPEGDFARGYDTTVHGFSSHFAWLNRSKESIVLDLKRDSDRSALDRLIERADVFVQNLSPRAASALGLLGGQLVARHPRLIACDISGYGGEGPYRDRKAYDLLIQCETGLVSITGTPADPVKAGISVADIAGGMYAYSGVLSALYERERTGRGAALEVSLFDSLTEWMGYPFYYTGYGGTPPPRTGAHHATIAPYGPFGTRCGGTVVLAVQNDREWRRLCSDVLGDGAVSDDPRFADAPSRVAHREALDAWVSACCAELDAVELERRLETAQIAHGRMRSVSEALDHPQLAAAGRHAVDSPGGPVRVYPPVVRASGRPLRLDPIPALGEHTDAILRELGADAA